MLKAIQNRTRDDKGFTLIELMVVVLIIAILIAIAIPTFLGMRRRAQDRAAQSNLRNAMTAAKAAFTDNETYVGFNAAAGTATEPSLAWIDGNGPTASGRQVAVDTAEITQSYVKLGALSASGTYFCIQENAGVNGFGEGTTWLLAEGDCADADWATP
jgi:type IV pilus assembly protein PilA